MADYGIVMLTCMAMDRGKIYTARDMADIVHITHSVASKVLKLLGRAGILSAHRGIKGGYGLARDPGEITLAAVIRALEGPIAFTECTGTHGECDREPGCPVRGNWQIINRAVQSTLEKVTLDGMTRPLNLSQMGPVLTGSSAATRETAEKDMDNRL